MTNRNDPERPISWKAVREIAAADPGSSRARALHRLRRAPLERAPRAGFVLRFAPVGGAALLAVLAAVALPGRQSVSPVAPASSDAPTAVASVPLESPSGVAPEAVASASATVSQVATSPSASAPHSARVAKGAPSERPVVVEKFGEGVRVSWAGQSGERYRVSRCWIGQGIEACSDVATLGSDSFVDPRNPDPFGLTLYRVEPVRESNRRG